ncbi:MAG: chemoreceptor glutamine deamidase CheD [Alphaproteobacteria bacterium]|nr:chemoreceptor glutamine deamidase CheD [Alphaproteobacteria bacterium]
MNLAQKPTERRQRRGIEEPLLNNKVRRYRDPEFNATVVKVLPGEHYVTDVADEMIVTVLGSCIAACIRDPLIKFGGMNHFMLPQSADGAWGAASASMRYGNFAMEVLINEILSRGGRRERLEIKVFGGGNVLAGSTPVGTRNAAFVESYLAAEGLTAVASHLRGNFPRRVHYFPVTGKVMMRELKRTDDQVVLDTEKSYLTKLSTPPSSGDIELFD